MTVEGIDRGMMGTVVEADVDTDVTSEAPVGMVVEGVERAAVAGGVRAKSDLLAAFRRGLLERASSSSTDVMLGKGMSVSTHGLFERLYSGPGSAGDKFDVDPAQMSREQGEET